VEALFKQLRIKNGIMMKAKRRRKIYSNQGNSSEFPLKIET
jgi:hypothetical protein